MVMAVMKISEVIMLTKLFQKSLSMEWAKPFGRIASRILDSVVFPDSDLLDKLKKFVEL